MGFFSSGGLLGMAKDALDEGPTTTQNPWEPQGDELRNAYAGARSLYNQGPQQYYGGQNVAGINPMLQNYFGGMQGQTDRGVGAGQDIMGYGQQGAQGLGQAQSFYSDALNNYYNPYASSEYSDIVSGSVNNNPLLDQQIASAQGDINRNMQENILPSIAGSSVATGNTGSTRRGVAEGVAMRGASEAGADAALGLRSNAYNQGMQQANQWAGAENAARFTSAGMLNQMGQQGVGNMAGGYNLGTQAYQDLMGAGAYERGIEQEQIGGEMDRWNFEQQAPWQNLQNYYNIVGSGNWGGTSTQTTQGQGWMPQALGMGAQLYGAQLAGGG